MNKPRVTTKCVASHYSARNERIIEFSSDVDGGLISFREIEGRLRVEVYRQDKTVDVVLNQTTH